MLELLNQKFFSLPLVSSLLISIVFFFIIGLIAWKKKHLSFSGSAGSFIVGIIIFWTLHFEGIILILFFFCSANFIGKITKGKFIDNFEKKGDTRDIIQVLANSLFAAIAGLCWFFSYDNSFLIMFGAVIAEAVSDTWASGIGRLSKAKPLNIRNFKPVETGLSGGITVLGTFSALIGAALTAVLWYFLFNISGALIVGAMGFAGCIIDSLLGACVQGHYWNNEEGRMTEKEFINGNKLDLCQGIRWVDNDMVNFLSTVFAGTFAIGLSILPQMLK